LRVRIEVVHPEKERRRGHGTRPGERRFGRLVRRPQRLLGGGEEIVDVESAGEAAVGREHRVLRYGERMVAAIAQELRQQRRLTGDHHVAPRRTQRQRMAPGEETHEGRNRPRGGSDHVGENNRFASEAIQPRHRRLGTAVDRQRVPPQRVDRDEQDIGGTLLRIIGGEEQDRLPEAHGGLGSRAKAQLPRANRHVE
jgi:hypothetical protein